MAADVHVEANIPRIGSRRTNRSEVGLSEMDHAITGVTQECRQCLRMHGSFDSRFWTQPVHVPFRETECRVTTIVAGVLSQRPVCHSVPRRVQARH